MTARQRLTLVRGLHTAIYLVMAFATFVVLYAGATGAHGVWLWVATGLIGAESVVFAASGMRCPLTAVVARYDAGASGISDTFLPERLTRHTLQVFGPLVALGFGLLAVRWVTF
ncbi:hypothetical protein [Phenylobacterium sp.]|uniref:hypothetical protein n=1 Tax=Phenylobacterium sp. TaxID=1871053 RepID=UPI0025F5A41D|nr:hypothetical protein [Phenylobacterium sp.]